MTTKFDPEAENEAAFLRRLAKQLGVAELSEEALATALGFDELTDEKLDQWFVTTMRRWLDETGATPRAAEHVVQVDRQDEPQPAQTHRLALPAKPKRRKRG